MRTCILSIAFVVALLLATVKARAQHDTRVGPTEAADIERGQKIYEKNCVICHFGTSAEKKIGPGLKGMMKRDRFLNGWKANNENMRRWIVNGGKNMPPSRLNNEQIRELIAYVKTL